MCCYILELDDLRREKRELEDSCRLLEQQLQHQQDHSNSEQQRQLQTRRRRQEELEGRIHILEQQKKNLISKTEEVSDLYNYDLTYDDYSSIDRVLKEYILLDGCIIIIM